MSAQLRKFTVEQYHRMVELGVLAENDRVELIRGEIVEMLPISTRHAACVRRLNNLLSEKLRGRALVDTQNLVELDDSCELRPDVTLLQLRDDFYETAHPQPVDIFLIVEVADLTVKYDRQVKLSLYAEDKITEVWLVNITEKSVEVYREPTPEGYRTIRELWLGQVLTIQAFPDVTFTVNEVLGV